MEYLDVPAAKAYALLNAGGVVWVCTRSVAGRYDLAPVAWNCPLDYEPTSKVLFVCDRGHATYGNVLGTRRFTLALPRPEQRSLVDRTGSCSGRDRDKYAEFGIEGIEVEGALVPGGCAAWLECSLIRVVEEGSVGVVMGEVLRARALPDAARLRLHHVAEGRYYRAGEEL